MFPLWNNRTFIELKDIKGTGKTMCHSATIKALIRHLVERVGGAKIAAKVCGVSETELSYWKLDHHNRFIPIDHLMDLDAAGDDLFLKEWARLRGYELVKAEVDQACNVTEAIKAVGPLMKEAGEAASITINLAADGHISETDKRLIRDEIAHVKDATALLERAIA